MDSSLKETWLNLLGIQSEPLKSHKMCSLHFPARKKSFGAFPTVVKISCRQTVNSSQGRVHIDNKTLNKTITETIQPGPQTTAIDTQETANEKLRTEHAALQRKYDELSCKYEQCVLRVEHVLANDTTFKFCSGFQNCSTFKVFFYFLQPACNFLTYAGSSNNIEYLEESKKLGRKRSISPEQELFIVLVPLRCGLMGVYIAHRSGISEAHVSRIWANWLEFLYHRLRAIPIWASRDYIQQIRHNLSKKPTQMPV